MASGYVNNTIGLWIIARGKKIKTLSGHSDLVYKLVFSGDGEYLASGSLD